MAVRSKVKMLKDIYFPRQRVRSEGEALGGVVGGWHMVWKR